MGNKLKPQSGFTIIEFLIAMTILGIITSLAVPAFVGMLSTYQADGQQRKMLSSLKYAQSEAVKRKQFVSVCVAHQTTADTCSTINTDVWGQGWFVFVDVNGDRAITPVIDTILRVESNTSDISIVHAGSLRAYTYNQTGQLIFGTGDIRICGKNANNTACSNSDSYHNTFTTLGSGQIVVL